MERDDIPAERHLADALRRLSEAAIVPPPDPAREAALMAAFDAAQASSGRRGRRDLWHMAALTAAAAVLIVAGLGPATSGRRGTSSSGSAGQTPLPARDVRLEPPGEFVIVPGAAGLPPMESGTLVRMDVPVAVLPSLGVTPPADRAAAVVTADLVVAQDGLPRAVRVVRTSTAP